MIAASKPNPVNAPPIIFRSDEPLATAGGFTPDTLLAYCEPGRRRMFTAEL